MVRAMSPELRGFDMNLHEISLSGGHLAGLMGDVLEKSARFRFRAGGFIVLRR
jgi:hypothetical protein